MLGYTVAFYLIVININLMEVALYAVIYNLYGDIIQYKLCMRPMIYVKKMKL